MTSDRYAKEDRWDPLESSRRKWETNSTAGTISLDTYPNDGLSANLVPKRRYQPQDQNDVPDEGSYASEPSGNGKVPSAAEDRPSAPQLAEDHVWGIREDWGEKAGRWGKGAAAFGTEARTEKAK